jgi:hypothetical protein
MTNDRMNSNPKNSISPATIFSEAPNKRRSGDRMKKVIGYRIKEIKRRNFLMFCRFFILLNFEYESLIYC